MNSSQWGPLGGPIGTLLKLPMGPLGNTHKANLGQPNKSKNTQKMNSSQWGPLGGPIGTLLKLPMGPLKMLSMECHEKVEAPFSILFNYSAIYIIFYTTSKLRPAL